MFYSNKLVSNLIWTFVCNRSYLYFRYNLNSLGNFLTISFFAYHSRVYTIKPNLVTKKKT